MRHSCEVDINVPSDIANKTSYAMNKLLNSNSVEEESMDIMSIESGGAIHGDGDSYYIPLYISFDDNHHNGNVAHGPND